MRSGSLRVGRPRISIAAATALALLAAATATANLGCSSSTTAAAPATDGGAAAQDDGGSDPATVGGDRPVTVHVPASYVAGTATPLVILLHGYGASGALQDLYFGLTPLSDTRGFLYAYPDGTLDADGKRFWNATDACCDLGGTHVDDAAYIHGLITEIKSRYTVDPKRVFVVGHSNGGFMSYRMACDHADEIAAIASLAGAMYSDVARCAPSGPVSVLEIHGDADETVAYAGGNISGHAFPGAQTTVLDWATIDGCASTPDTSAPLLDLDTRLAGSETTVTTYASACKPGGHAELWTIKGGSHLPSLTSSFATGVVDFLYAHPKP